MSKSLILLQMVKNQVINFIIVGINDNYNKINSKASLKKFNFKEDKVNKFYENSSSPRRYRVKKKKDKEEKD